jgi:hypothetical protein
MIEGGDIMLIPQQEIHKNAFTEISRKKDRSGDQAPLPDPAACREA